MANNLREALARAFALRRAYEMSRVQGWPEGKKRDKAATKWVDEEWQHFVLQADAALSVIRKWLESEEAASAANFAFGQALIDQLHLVPSNDGAAQTRSIVSHSDRLVGMSAALKSLSANLEGTGE